MTVLGLILGNARLAVFAFSLVRLAFRQKGGGMKSLATHLKAVLRAPWTGEKLVLADLAASVLDTARAGLERIWSSKFRQFLKVSVSKYRGGMLVDTPSRTSCTP